MAEQVILVQKDIALAAGESLGSFSQKLREAGTDYVARKLNVLKDTAGNSGASIYPIEIFSKSAIFSVYKYGPTVKQTERDSFYAVAYSRKSDGSFEFSTLTEVERVVGFQAKQTATPVNKAAAQEQHEGWVTKSLWAGVV